MGSVRLSLARNAGGVIHVLAIPKTKLELTIDGKLEPEGSKLNIKLEGKCTNLPKGTPCRVTWYNTPDGGGEVPIPGGTIPLGHDSEPDGDGVAECSLTSTIDVFEHRVLQRGSLRAEVEPDFRNAEKWPVGAKRYDVKCDFSTTPDVTKAGALAVGKRIEIALDVASSIHKCAFRLRFFERDDDPKEPQGSGFGNSAMTWAAGGGTLAERLLWGRERVWRAGCVGDDGPIVVDYPEEDEVGNYEVELILEGSPDEGKTFFPVKSVRCVLEKPWLTRFDVSREEDGDFIATGTVAGLERGTRLPLEVRLWKRTQIGEPKENVWSVVEVGNEVHRVDLDGDGHFKMNIGKGASAAEGFAVLRIPPAATGSKHYLPFRRVIFFSSQACLLPHHLPPDPPDVAATIKRAKNTKDEDVATAICSFSDEDQRLVRLPQFGDIEVLIRSEYIIFMCPALGDPDYWSKAAPKLSLSREQGAKELDAKLEDGMLTAALKLNSRVIFGKEIAPRMFVGNPDAKLAGSVTLDIAPKPVTYPDPITCKPLLDAPRVGSLQKLENGDPYRRIVTKAHYFPTWVPRGKQYGLAYRFFKYVGDKEVPVTVNVRYSIPDTAKTGRVSSEGQLVGDIVGSELDKLEEGGLFVGVKRHKDTVMDMNVKPNRALVVLP